MRPVRRLGGGCLSAFAAAFAMLIACANGTGTGTGDLGDGGALDGDIGRDVNVVPTPKDSAPPGDTGGPGDDSGSCTSQVLINELKTDGTSDPNDEMIELYNPSACAVPLGNWEIKYESAGGGAGLAGHKFATGDAIMAKSYLVLKPSSVSAKLTPGMKATDGQIGLLDDTAKLVDAVAYGTVTAGSYREKQSAPSPSGGSVGRSPSGVDTDDNKADFKAYATPSEGVANP